MNRVDFSCINTLTVNYIIVVISPLFLTASLVSSRWAEVRWKERRGRGCYSFPHGRKGMSLWPPLCPTTASTAEPVQLESSSRFFFPGFRTRKKDKKKEKKNLKKKNPNPLKMRSLTPHVPALPREVRLTLPLPPGLPNSRAWAVRGHEVVCYSNKRTYNLRCLWPCCVPARYINRSQVKPECLLANILKIKAYVLSVVNKVTHTRHLFSLRVSKARSVVWGEETATWTL